MDCLRCESSGSVKGYIESIGHNVGTTPTANMDDEEYDKWFEAMWIEYLEIVGYYDKIKEKWDFLIPIVIVLGFLGVALFLLWLFFFFF